jgi:hypothetical protein
MPAGKVRTWASGAGTIEPDKPDPIVHFTRGVIEPPRTPRVGQRAEYLLYHNSKNKARKVTLLDDRPASADRAIS